MYMKRMHAKDSCRCMLTRLKETVRVVISSCDRDGSLLSWHHSDTLTKAHPPTVFERTLIRIDQVHIARHSALPEPRLHGARAVCHQHPFMCGTAHHTEPVTLIVRRARRAGTGRADQQTRFPGAVFLPGEHEGTIGTLLDHPGITVCVHKLEKLGELGLRIKGWRRRLINGERLLRRLRGEEIVEFLVHLIVVIVIVFRISVLQSVFWHDICNIYYI